MRFYYFLLCLLFVINSQNLFAQNNWVHADSGLYDYHEPIDIMEHDNGELWLFTYGVVPGNSFSPTIYTSSNEGTNWSVLPLPNLNNLGMISCATKSDGNIIIGGGRDGSFNYDARISVSSDNGNTWVTATGYNNFRPRAFTHLDSTKILMTSSEYVQAISAYENRFYESIDHGLSWQQTSTDGLDSLGETSCMTYVGNRVVMGGVHKTQPKGQIYVSSDTGQTWVKQQNGFDSSYVPKAFAVDKNGHTYLLCDKRDTSNIYFFYHKLYRSTDNCNSWSMISTTGDSIGYAYGLAIVDNILYMTGVNDSNGIFSAVFRSDLPTSIQKPLNPSLKLNYFPNPVQQNLNIQLEQAKDIQSLRIFSMTGVEVWSQTYHQKATIQELISLKHLMSGFYVLQVESSDQTNSYKLIKN